MFSRENGIVVACDVNSLDALAELVQICRGSQVVVGYKVGFSLGLRYSLPTVVKTIKALATQPVIYDHQKAGTDIPQMGLPFAKVCAESGVDSVIIFPQAGPETMLGFLQGIKEMRMVPIVGGVMTHPRYLENDGGFIRDGAPAEIYRCALDLGVTHFVLPGNKPEVIRHHVATTFGGQVGLSLVMPGIGTQGGQIRDSFAATLPLNPYAIIGSAIYAADDPAAQLASFERHIADFSADSKGGEKT